MYAEKKLRRLFGQPLGQPEVMEETRSRQGQTDLDLMPPPVRVAPQRKATSEEVLRIALRLKHHLAGEEHPVIHFVGIEEEDLPDVASWKIGLALAQIESEPILLVDGNLRAPRLHTSFGFPPVPGLCECLEGSTSLDRAAFPSDAGQLFFLGAGNVSPGTLGLLTSENSKRLLLSLRSRFRYVLINTGLLRQSPEALALASLGNAAVMAIRRRARRKQEVDELKLDLQSLGLRLLGAIFT